MEIGKTRWRELGLTPRQLSKKIGATYSMAEFITQSYRKPVQLQGPACPHSPPCVSKCPKKNQCTCNKSGCEGAPGFATPSTSCGRKRPRCKEKRSDDECAWTERKEVYKCSNSSCLFPGSNACNKNSHSKTSTCSSSCRPRCDKPIAIQNTKCSRGRKKRKCKEKEKAKTRHKKTLKCCCATQPCPKKRMFPLGIHLDVPLNIFLDDEDGIEIEGKEVQVCKKWKNKSMAVQVPSQHEVGRYGPEGDQCQRPEHPPDQWGEETGDQEEIAMEECNPCEDDSSEEKEDCCEMIPAKDSSQTSWWEKVQEGMFFFESLLSSIINKC